jgi:hypothetical protein
MYTWPFAQFKAGIFHARCVFWGALQMPGVIPGAVVPLVHRCSDWTLIQLSCSTRKHMAPERRSWEESPEIFRAREGDEVRRHDIGGFISDIVNEETAQDHPHELTVLDGDEMEGNVATASNSVAVEVGLDVVGACGHKIGEVVDIRPNHLVVEKGFFAPEDVYVPKSAIAKADEHHVTLKVTREASEHSGWDEDPEGIEIEDLTEDEDERL